VAERHTSHDLIAALATITEVVGATEGMGELVDVVLRNLDEVFGFSQSLLLLYDGADTLFTIASHGFDTQGIGSEVPLGVGIIGMAAARRQPLRAANLKRLLTYARTIRRSAIEHGATDLIPEIPLPGLTEPQSQMAVPMLSSGALIGVIAVETAEPFSCYDDVDERVLSIVAGLTAKSIIVERALAGEANDEEPSRQLNGEQARLDVADGPRCHVRHFTGDGSTFLDDDYVIRGVAGRLLWKLAQEYVESGRIEFTNREARLDPLLQLPEYRDNFESRLILLKRRLDERHAALRIVSTARGRFRLDVERPLELERCIS
jgi:adenylate cyclase